MSERKNWKSYTMAEKQKTEACHLFDSAKVNYLFGKMTIITRNTILFFQGGISFQHHFTKNTLALKITEGFALLLINIFLIPTISKTSLWNLLPVSF